MCVCARVYMHVYGHVRGRGGCLVVMAPVAELWLHKPGVLGSVLGDRCPFHFHRFRLMTSSFPVSVYAHVHLLKLCSPSELRKRFASIALFFGPHLALPLAVALT